MANLILETGGGTALANAYVTAAWVDTYLQDRNRYTGQPWGDTATVDEQEAAIIEATTYIDLRFGQLFRGRPLATIAGQKARAVFTISVNPGLGDVLTIAGISWLYGSFIDPMESNEILIGTNQADTIANTIAALTGGAGAGTLFSEVLQQPDSLTVSAHPSQTNKLVFTAIEEGAHLNGQIYPVTPFTGSGITAFNGGVDQGPQPLEFPRSGLFDRHGNTIKGIPLNLQKATAEYAVRAQIATLLPDPAALAANASGPVSRLKEKVGELEVDTTFQSNGATGNQGAGGGIVSDGNLKQYPFADLMLADYLDLPSVFGRVGRA